MALLIALPVQVGSALVWGGIDGWRGGPLRALLVRWGLVAVIVAAFVTAYTVITLGDLFYAGELAGELFNQLVAQLVTIFVPAGLGAFGGVKAVANRATPFFEGRRHVPRDR